MPADPLRRLGRICPRLGGGGARRPDDGAKRARPSARACPGDAAGRGDRSHRRLPRVVLDSLLEAAISDREGKPEAALATAAKAAAKNDAIPFDFGPPATVKPPHEFAGELLLKVGRANEALAGFAPSLQAAPQRALSMLGRARALKAMGDTVSAAQAYSTLAAVWKNADADLPVLTDCRSETLVLKASQPLV